MEMSDQLHVPAAWPG